MNLLIPVAHAQAAAGSPTTASLVQFLPYLLILVVFYVIMLRPQQQQAKKLKAELAALKRGDRVLTAGGIIGTVQKFSEGSTEIDIEIAPAVRVTVLRETLTGVMTSTTKSQSGK